MIEKNAFKTSSTSYSQFLRSKKAHIHCLTEPSDMSIDIDFFKRSIAFHYQHMYATKKWHNWLYRFIFFGFSVVFAVLGILIFFKVANHSCGYYFSECSIAKNCVNVCCLLLSGSAFALGYQIHPEKDAIRHLVSKVEKELNSPAKQLQIEFNAIFANLSHEDVTH